MSKGFYTGVYGSWYEVWSKYVCQFSYFELCLCIAGFLCVIALMSDRISAMYKDLFSVLDRYATRLQLSFCPTRISSDYENALVKTIADEVNETCFQVLNDRYYAFFTFPMLTIVGVTFTIPSVFIVKFKHWVLPKFIEMILMLVQQPES